jgi:hypothetical protein
MNPVELAHKIAERYRRYLKTTFYFRDQGLRASFEDKLGSGHLTKGPYIEATAVFQRGRTADRLFKDLLGTEVDQSFLDAIYGQRPLYCHQEESIRRVLADHNLVVATGTGSGKTEAFLYPILLHLYREFQAGTLCPGVRALVLYPMNALANDQRERLGEICRRLQDGESPLRLTFGQYTGEAPEDEADSRRNARDRMAQRLPGELVLRSEMRSAPPHILLTNYSMLEYLLLRPDDSPFFDNGAARWWSFLVLDEAHQYRGTKGIEMAMLLRRLKQRLREGGRTGSFRCIATSATLAGGEADKAAVAKFASDLFGEPFTQQDVILGEFQPLPEPGTVALAREDYQALSRALRDSGGAPETLGRMAIGWGMPVPNTGDTSKAIGALLERDGRAGRLRRLLASQPVELQKVADQIFSDLSEEAERAAALADLIALLSQANDPQSGAPLLSARCHFFLRSLEGAFLSLWPDKQVLLERSVPAEGTLFEVALCRECGQHYLVGSVVKNKLQEAVRDPGHLQFGATFFLPLDALPDQSDDANGSDAQNYRLCVRCGEIRPSAQQLQCEHNTSVLIQKQREAEEREDQIPRCAACGYRGRDPVREVVHGADGPHAVIATTLCQELPEDRRKVLAFADSRQEAAFFAWYLEKSYKDILDRNLLLQALRAQTAHAPDGLSLRDVATGLKTIFRRSHAYPASESELQLRREAWLAVYREFLTDEPRISLEGVGVARWLIQWPEWFSTPRDLLEPPWCLSEQEARDLTLLLLDSMRNDRAVELRADARLDLDWNRLDLQAAQGRCRIGPPTRQPGVHSWDGRHGRRVRLLAKLLVMRINPGLAEQPALDAAENAARHIWQALQQCDQRAPTPDEALLVRVGDARRLNPDWWRFRLLQDSDTVLQCDVCGRLQTISVRGLCSRYGCRGSLQRSRRGELEPNHYRDLYEIELPGHLRVEEHTAQLDQEKAREFQRDFRQGRINVLSCSTTFELGVDLGNLDTIFLRNVPPEAFNYAQRVGRSGRRSGFPGFTITYCRRSPHDLYHFARPHRMLAGRVQPPVLALRNDRIFIRHMTALALSFFFRHFRDRFSNVTTLFGDLAEPSAVRDFRSFLLGDQQAIEQAISQVSPDEETGRRFLTNGKWIDDIAGENSRFALVEAELSSDYREVKDLENAAAEHRDAQKLDWAQKRAYTIEGEKALSFLSRKAVIPKYGFPVDVVELDTQRTQQNKESFEVSLQRDLSVAISEFAPTSSLVANKKEWKSYGLKKVAAKEWKIRLYARCAAHNVFAQWTPDAPEPPLSCGDQVRQPHKYVIPQFGFVAERGKPHDPRARPAKLFSTRPYFAGPQGPDPGSVQIPDAARPVVTLKKASPGLMVVLCEGRRGEGFYLCWGCGAGFRNRPAAHYQQPAGHKTPQGQDCYGTLEQVSLGHEFVTDVLQLQFHSSPRADADRISFAFSLAYSLVEGAAEVLEIPSNDLSTTVAYGDQHAVPPIVLYDNVPGGAGLVARLEREEVLKECLQTALIRVGGDCGCAPDTSCYGCLRSYRNQFAHDMLQRGPVCEYLKRIISGW